MELLFNFSSYGGKCDFVAHYDSYDLFILILLFWMIGGIKYNSESRCHREDYAQITIHKWFKLASGFKQEFWRSLYNRQWTPSDGSHDS